LSAAFIPVFTGYLAEKKDAEAWELANSLLNLALVALGIASVLIFIFAHPLTSILAPGFNAAKQNEVVVLTRIMLLSPILFGVSSIAGGVLNSFNRFWAYALAPILYNLGIIFGVLVLTPHFGVKGLAYGVVIGAFLHFLIQVTALRSLGYKYQPRIRSTKPLKRVVALMLPRSAALGVMQLNLLIETVIASTLAIGSVAIINLANNLQTVVSGIVGLSIATAVFPVLARFASSDEKDAFVAQLMSALRQTFYFTIPLGVLVILLRAQIVRVILGSGQFNWEDTKLTAATLGVFALSLFAQSAAYLINRAFYAVHDTISPLKAGLVAATLNIVFSVSLAYKFGVVGLAGGWTAANILYFLYLFIVLQRKLHIVEGRGLVVLTTKIVCASGVMGLATYITLHLVAPLVNMERVWGIFTQGMVGGLVGIVCYFFASRAMGVAEADQILSWLRNRKDGEPASESDAVG
jgi:putative peptidoglycan lipid II flippase